MLQRYFQTITMPIVSGLLYGAEATYYAGFCLRSFCRGLRKGWSNEHYASAYHTVVKATVVVAEMLQQDDAPTYEDYLELIESVESPFADNEFLSGDEPINDDGTLLREYYSAPTLTPTRTRVQTRKDYTRRELLKIAKQQHYPNYSRLSKADLLNGLREAGYLQ